MTPIKGLVQTLKGWLGKPVASPESDPLNFVNSLFALPNPDPILRQMGRADAVYQSIMMDGHVIGELRSIRGSFRSHEYRIVAGRDGDTKSEAARDLCIQWMDSAPPNDVADWLEVMWQMCACIFTGYRAHELVWNLVDGKYLPTEVIDRPGRRIHFDAYGAPLLVTRSNMMGEPVEPYQFCISRHMPTSDNPYGIALLSACFWPWTFKTGGWRYFVKYCERHGLPWPVGRYPQGADDKDINRLEQALAGMMEAGYVVAQEGTGLELLTPTSSGSSLPQERLIMLVNREMSKALTSQAMVGEQMEVGSRAAAETAKDRQSEVHDSDRDIAAASMSSIFQWITLFNFGEGVEPPKLEFFKKTAAGKDRAEAYQIAANLGGKPSRKAMLDELDIPEAQDDADALLPSSKPQAESASAPAQQTGKSALRLVNGVPTPASVNFAALEGFTFAKAAGMTESDAIQLAADAADSTVEDTMIEPVYQMLVQFERDGKTLEQFRDQFADLVGDVDDEGLREVVERSLTYAMLRGAATNAS